MSLQAEGLYVCHYPLYICHYHLIFLSPVHHHHHHHHHHHFHYASLHLCSTPDSKLTVSINPSHHSLPYFFGRISRIFTTISVLNCSFFVLLFSFHPFLFDLCDRLISASQLLNCTFLPFHPTDLIQCILCVSQQLLRLAEKHQHTKLRDLYNEMKAGECLPVF